MSNRRGTTPERPRHSLLSMATPLTPEFDSVLRRMFERQGVDTLPDHLETAYGMGVAKMSQLDIGVFRIDRSGKEPPLVARLFSADRPYAAAEADLAVLRYLAEIGFRAERPFADKALSMHDGQAL